MGKSLKVKRHPDLAATDVIDELLPGVFGHHSVPALKRFQVLRIDSFRHRRNGCGEVDLCVLRCALQFVKTVCGFGLLGGPAVVTANLVDDLRQVSSSLWRNDVLLRLVCRGQVE